MYLKFDAMKFILFLMAVLPLTNPRCIKAKPGLPDCIQSQIDAIRKQPKWNPPAEVNEYIFEGRTVYLFSSPCCDQHNKLYDIDCNYICAPSGGYTGRGDEKCTSFNEEAKHVRLVWKDDR